MSKMTYVAGDTKPVLFPTDPSYPINEGDLLFKHPATGKVRPASALPNQGTKMLNQDAFQQYFAGVALAKTGLQSGETSFRLQTDPGYVQVATEGDFDYPCPSQTFVTGAPIGVYATTNGCSSQEVDSASTNMQAIGVAVPGEASIVSGVAVTQIVVRIKSSVMYGDVVLAAANSGSGQ